MFTRKFLIAAVTAASMLYVAAVHTIAAVTYAKDTNKKEDDSKSSSKGTG